VDLIGRVYETIIREELLFPGEVAVVGVSGGLDSMVLLELLLRVGEWPLQVAHFNHCLRADESDVDEAFVRAAAERLSLRFISERGDVKARAREQGISIEMAARELRYEFLESAAGRLGAERIVLAHHADDQVETFWLRLLRGDAGPGLAGMRWKRPAEGKGKMIVRPLLGVRKKELVEFARLNKISFREDTSNASTDFQRNRLRLEIIPQLEKVQAGLQQITWRAAEVLAAEKDFLEATAREFLKTPKGEYTRLHKALQREIIRLQLMGVGLKPSFDLIETLRLSANIPVSVSEKNSVIRDEDGQVRVVTGKTLTFHRTETSMDLDKNGSTSSDDCVFDWRLREGRGPAAAGVEYFDASQIGPRGTIRYWQAGDRFQPIGMATATKVQDLFTNAKVSAEEKRGRFVAIDADGKIFWVEGLRISELHKVTPQTTRVLEWKWRRQTER
jgi:tRNA(Ile)-lysidine synthase